MRGVGMAWAENLRFSMPEMSAESISLLEVQLLRGHVVEAAEASIHLLQTLGREAGADLPSDLLVRLLYVALQALFMLERCGYKILNRTPRPMRRLHGTVALMEYAPSSPHAGRTKLRICLTPPWVGHKTCLAERFCSGESCKCLSTVMPQGWVHAARTTRDDNSTLEILVQETSFAFRPRQLLLNDCGRASEAKLHLERRLSRLGEQPMEQRGASLGEHPLQPSTGSTPHLELLALSRCYALDTLCEGMGDHDGAAAWLTQQLDAAALADTGGSSSSGTVIVVGLLPQEQVQQLLMEVHERKSRADQSSVSTALSAAALRSGKQLPSRQAAQSASPSDFCTMTGELSGEEDEGQAVVHVRSDAVVSGKASALIASGAAAAVRHPASPSRSPSSARLVFSKWWMAACGKVRPWLLQCATRLNAIGGIEGGAKSSWLSTLYALASCALLFALVAEGRTLGAAAKLWWRQLRAALRSIMAELLSMGLSITPNPLTNGYAHRPAS